MAWHDMSIVVMLLLISDDKTRMNISLLFSTSEYSVCITMVHLMLLSINSIIVMIVA